MAKLRSVLLGVLLALCCSIVVTAEFVGDINVDSNFRLFSSIKVSNISS